MLNLADLLDAVRGLLEKYKCSEEVIEATEKEIKANIMKDKFIREKIAELESQYHAQFSEATMSFRVKPKRPTSARLRGGDIAKLAQSMKVSQKPLSSTLGPTESNISTKSTPTKKKTVRTSSNNSSTKKDRKPLAQSMYQRKELPIRQQSSRLTKSDEPVKAKRDNNNATSFISSNIKIESGGYKEEKDDNDDNDGGDDGDVEEVNSNNNNKSNNSKISENDKKVRKERKSSSSSKSSKRYETSAVADLNISNSPDKKKLLQRQISDTIILNNENDSKSSVNTNIKPLLLQLQDKIKELGNSNETLSTSLKSVVDKLKETEKQRDHYKELYESQKKMVEELKQFKESIVTVNSILCIE